MVRAEGKKKNKQQWDLGLTSRRKARTIPRKLFHGITTRKRSCDTTPITCYKLRLFVAFGAQVTPLLVPKDSGFAATKQKARTPNYEAGLSRYVVGARWVQDTGYFRGSFVP